MVANFHSSKPFSSRNEHSIKVAWQELISNLREEQPEIVANAWLDHVVGRASDDLHEERDSAFLLWPWLRSNLVSGVAFTKAKGDDLLAVREIFENAIKTITKKKTESVEYFTKDSARQARFWVRGSFHVAAAIWAFHSRKTIASQRDVSAKDRTGSDAVHASQVLQWLCRGAACFQVAMTEVEGAQLYQTKNYPKVAELLDFPGLLGRVHDFWDVRQHIPCQQESVEIIRHLAEYLLPSETRIPWARTTSTIVSLLAPHEQHLIPVKASLHVMHRAGGQVSLIYPDPIGCGLLAFDQTWRETQEKVRRLLQTYSPTKTLCWSLRFHSLSAAGDVARKFPISSEGPRFINRFRRPFEVTGDSAGGAFGLLAKIIFDEVSIDTQKCLMICGIDESGRLHSVEEFAKISEGPDRLSWMEHPRHLIFSPDITTATREWLDDYLGVEDSYRTAATINEAIEKLQELQGPDPLVAEAVEPQRLPASWPNPDDAIEDTLERSLVRETPKVQRPRKRKSVLPTAAAVFLGGAALIVIVLVALPILQNSKSQTNQTRKTVEPETEQISKAKAEPELQPPVQEYRRRFVAYSYPVSRLPDDADVALRTFLREIGDAQTHFRLSKADWEILNEFCGPINSDTRFGLFVVNLDRDQHVPRSLQEGEQFDLAVLGLQESRWVWFTETRNQGFQPPPNARLGATAVTLDWPDKRQRIALILFPKPEAELPDNIEFAIFDSTKGQP